MRIAIYTLGCKVNQVESWALADEFTDMGATIVDHKESADFYVINTCTVTARAAYQSRQMIRRLRREHPEAGIIATGCHVQTSHSEMATIISPPLWIAGNDSKHLIPSIVRQADSASINRNAQQIIINDINKVKTTTLCRVQKPRNRTRGFLKIQDGCNAFCSYCIVPHARGRSRSLPPEQIMEQTALYHSNGVKEIVVTGIHVGLYGHDLIPSTDLFTLLRSLCKGFPDIRFRLSSIEPTEITTSMLTWAAETPNFCRHWHIPLQSGSDRILSAMHRNYDSVFFMNVLDEIHTIMPDAAIGVDVMAGFPSETDADFHKTVSLIRESPVTYVHAFPYSRRTGTPASEMPNQIEKKTRKERANIIRALGQEKKNLFYMGQRGSVHTCLVEQKDKTTGQWKGFTENYLPVLINAENTGDNMENRLLNVKIDDCTDKFCLCAI